MTLISTHKEWHCLIQRVCLVLIKCKSCWSYVAELPPWSRALEKLLVVQLVEKCHNFIFVFIRCRRGSIVGIDWGTGCMIRGSNPGRCKTSTKLSDWREIYRSLPSSAEVKNAWSYTSTVGLHLHSMGRVNCIVFWDIGPRPCREPDYSYPSSSSSFSFRTRSIKWVFPVTILITTGLESGTLLIKVMQVNDELAWGYCLIVNIRWTFYNIISCLAFGNLLRLRF